jgi:FtsZ-binding cell division protein ZapB
MNLNERKKQLIKENQEAITEYEKAVQAANAFKAKAFSCQERLKEIEMLLVESEQKLS